MKDGFIKIATGVFKISLGDCSANADKIIRMAADMSKKGVKLACFTELCVTGYTLEDVFSQKVLQESAEQAVERIAAGTAKYDILFAVGVPVTYGSGTYNCAAVICRGKLLALVPKTEIPNYNEFYEGRKFYSGKDVDTVVKYAGFTVPLTAKAVFKCESVSDLTVGFELCEDLWVASPPSIKLAQNGANVIFNLSCSNEIIGKSEYRRSLVMGQSGRLICAYASASAGMGESTSDLVFSGHCVIAENGRVMSEQRWENDKFIEADIDVQRLCSERRRMTGFRDAQSEKHTVIGFELNTEKTQVNRNISPTPFVPQDSAELTARCEEILRIQSAGLKQRLSAIGCKCAVLGLSGGSTRRLRYL